MEGKILSIIDQQDQRNLRHEINDGKSKKKHDRSGDKRANLKIHVRKRYSLKRDQKTQRIYRFKRLITSKSKWENLSVIDFKSVIKAI